jgi:RNA polymerase sigma-19 factor, ECF subfamily
MNQKEFDFSSLCIELKKRNPLATKYLFDRYYQPVFNFAKEKIKDADKARSIFSDVLENGVILKIDNFNSYEEVRNYLYQTVRDKCDQFLEGQNFQQLQTAELLKVLHKKGLSEQEVEGNIFQELYNNIEKLPQQRRYAIWLLFFCRIKSEEAANLMGISRQTVLNHKTKAIDQLLQAFGKKGPLTAVFLIGLSMLFLLQV